MAGKHRSVFKHDPEVIVALHARFIAGEELTALGAEIGIAGKALLCQFHHKGLGSREKRHWWSLTELKAAKQRIVRGDDIEEIAKRLGVKESQLYRALLKWGFNPTPYTGCTNRAARRKEDHRIFSLRQKGLSYGQIASALGWPDSQSGQRRVGRRIKAYCDKAGIPIPLVEVVLRRDGTRRRVGYGPNVHDSIKRSMAARQGRDFT